MRIDISTYRALSIMLFALLIIELLFLTDELITGAIVVFVSMIVIVLAQAGLLRCHHCGTRPGLWILAIWTLLLDPVLYLADALFLRNCPNCKKSLYEKMSQGDGTVKD